jgi:hypothetical protein
MNIRNLGWVLGAACLSIGGAFAMSACSSSNPPPAAGDPVDSGGQSQADTGSSPAMDSGGGNNDMDAGSGNECGSTPKLHPGDGGSLYCPFGPDGSALDCPTASTICCIGGEISRGNYAVSQCGATGQTCPNPLPDAGMYPARAVECEEAVDCQGGGKICCATGGTPAADMSCGYYKESPGFTATTCVSGSTCPAGQFQMCGDNNECGSGKTCVPFKALGIQLGFCQ